MRLFFPQQYVRLLNILYFELFEYRSVLFIIVICGASSRKPYNGGKKLFFFLADLNSPYSKL